MNTKGDSFRIGLILAVLASVALSGWTAPAASAEQPANTGVRIWLASNSPYYEAGLRTGDLITKGNGLPIVHDGDFYEVFAATTTTKQIVAEGTRADGSRFRVTVPAYLPTGATVASIGWDWVRYQKYYAADAGGPDPLLRQAYEDFDNRSFARAQIRLTSATAKGHKDPLTLTKLAWLLVSRRTSAGSNTDRAGKLLKMAEEAYDASMGDKETGSKLEGTYMIYFQRLKNPSMAAIRGRRAIALAPHLVGNRINYYLMLTEAKQYDDAAMAAGSLAHDYPCSVYFQRLRRTAYLRVNQFGEVIKACEALIAITPDDIPNRLQVLPYYEGFGDTFRLSMSCDRLLRDYSEALNEKQKGEIHYYQASVNYKRRIMRKAESLARQAVSLRGRREDYMLLGNIMHDRRKWKDAVVAYHTAQGKPYGSLFRSRSREQRYTQAREERKRMDACVEHLWSWQVKKLPDSVQGYVKKRKEYLREREVLKHSFVLRNRYEIRNTLIGVGLLMIFSGVLLKALQKSF